MHKKTINQNLVNGRPPLYSFSAPYIYVAKDQPVQGFIYFMVSACCQNSTCKKPFMGTAQGMKMSAIIYLFLFAFWGVTSLAAKEYKEPIDRCTYKYEITLEQVNNPDNQLYCRWNRCEFRRPVPEKMYLIPGCETLPPVSRISLMTKHSPIEKVKFSKDFVIFCTNTEWKM